jgi:hypothetical protein
VRDICCRHVRRTARALALGAFIGGLFSSAVIAAGIEGAWSTDTAACSKIFVKTGDRISFTTDADLHGSGFIVDGNRLRGKMASCNIIKRKQDGATLHLIANCSTEIAIETMQLSLKFVDDNTVSRLFPGMPEMEITYRRCSF